MLGSVKVAVVQTNQGSRGQTGAANITKRLLGVLKPKAVVLVGVCFGTPALVLGDPVNRKLRIGDVLVGSKLIQYDHGAERDGDRELRGHPYVVARLPVCEHSALLRLFHISCVDTQSSTLTRAHDHDQV